MAKRTGHPVYEVDGYLVADTSSTVSGDETGATPGTPSSGVSGVVVSDTQPTGVPSGTLWVVTSGGVPTGALQVYS